jgi:rubrerythrin
MIAPRKASHNPLEINTEETIQVVLALLQEREPLNTSRWFCDVCGMIHLGATPVACDSCGNEELTKQDDTRYQINTRW